MRLTHSAYDNATGENGCLWLKNNCKAQNENCKNRTFWGAKCRVRGPKCPLPKDRGEIDESHSSQGKAVNDKAHMRQFSSCILHFSFCTFHVSVSAISGKSLSPSRPVSLRACSPSPCQPCSDRSMMRRSDAGIAFSRPIKINCNDRFDRTADRRTI